MYFTFRIILLFAALAGSAVIMTAGCSKNNGDSGKSNKLNGYSAYPRTIEPGNNDSGATMALSNQGNAVPLAPNPVPQHPFLNPNGRNGTHADAYSSGTYETCGPLGNDSVVTSAVPVDYWQVEVLGQFLAGECLTQTFSSDGNILFSL